MTAKSCAKCGGPLPVQTGRGRRRTKCENCSPSRVKAPKVTATPQAAGSHDGLLASVTAELSAAGRLGSHPGQAAVLLAQRIEFGENSGSAVAQMVRQLHDTMSRALADVQAEVDPVDELRARREQRRAGA